jgi:hypothetical protein
VFDYSPLLGKTLFSATIRLCRSAAAILQLGRKVSDEFTVPLCRGHHREVHRHGDEAAWWQQLGLDPAGAAHAMWLETHPQGLS